MFLLQLFIICVFGSDQGSLQTKIFLCGVFVADLWFSVYLVFLLELLHRPKLQHTHVDQPLQVLMKGENVSPDINNKTTRFRKYSCNEL